MGGRIHRLKPDGEWLLQREWKSQIRQRLEELALFSSVMVKKSAMGRFLFDLIDRGNCSGICTVSLVWVRVIQSLAVVCMHKRGRSLQKRDGLRLS